MKKFIVNPVYQVTSSALVIFAIYFPMLVKLANQWQNDDNYSHGFLIPLISAYLIYEKRHKIKELEVTPTYLGLGVVLFGMFIYLIGVIGADLFTQRFSFLVVLIGMVISLLGQEIFKEISFPLFYLIFMIPIPYVIFYAIASPLKVMATKLAVGILKEAGLPILHNGNQIFMPNVKLIVAYACSGLRSLISLMALGALFGYYTQTKTWKRLLVFAITIPTAIFANVVRIMSACLVAFVYGEEVATGFLHDFSGIVVFVVAVLVLILAGGLLCEGKNSVPSIS